MGTLLFWMSKSPDPNMDLEIWRSFVDTMAGWFVLLVIGFVAITIAVYAAAARAKKIRTPADVFAPYTPMRALFVAVVPAILLLLVYRWEFTASFPNTGVSWVGDAVVLALITLVVTLLGSYLLTWLPGITPTKYRYRPRPSALIGR